MHYFKNKTIVLLTLSILFSIQWVQAQKIEYTIGIKASEQYYQIYAEKKAPTNIYFVGEKNKNIVINFLEKGWIVMKDNAPEYTLLAFSDKSYFDVAKSPFYKGSPVTITNISTDSQKDILKNANYILDNTKDPNDYIPPFLTDVWGGVNCYDSSGSNIYPTNHFTPNHCSPGCVAISSSQIMHYYEWPITGVGSNVYIDEYEHTSEWIRHEAFFDNTAYDWENMLDEYMNIDSSIEEQEAVGTLIYHVGIAVEMDYENTGSTSNLNKMPPVLENFFRYSVNYHTSSWSSFWDRLYDNIQQLRPVPLAIENSDNGEGHVMVANGFKLFGSTPHYHINWGWYDLPPTNNGWYNIQGWSPGDTGYDTVIGAIFDLLPEPQITSIAATGTGDDFKVTWEVSDRLNWDEFTLEQKVDHGTWEEVATDITAKHYTITNPTGTVYQLRVKAKVNGEYYANSWSEREVYAVDNWYNGFAIFDGTKTFAKQTPDEALDFTGDYTFETWIRLKNGNQNGDVILDQKDVFGFEIKDVTGSDYSIVFKSHSTSAELNSNASGTKLSNNEWVHVAVSKTGSTAKLFVNGELRDTKTSEFNLTSANWYLNFGEKYHGSYSSFINADIDQLRISSVGRYSSTFTPDQKSHFDVDPNTVAYLTFQDVHRYRLKDEAHNLSVEVDDVGNYVDWDFEEIDGLVSVEEQEMFKQHLKVYPNPTQDFISIQYVENTMFNINDLNFCILSIDGKKIRDIANSQINNIDISSLPAGIYLLAVKGNNFNASIKIIKQ